MWLQKQIRLTAKPRGFHLITRELLDQLPELHQVSVGLAHVFIQHTSASLALNENADADVRIDLESYFSRSVAEREPYFRHTLEGDDDMPAHIKSILIGAELTIPLSKGQLALGTWQGIYLCEHRNHGGSRTVVVTIHGE